uniref:Uncharacterized protein n=1 Tax=Rhizophora mucronata TaxID=61149 RepID=A0A2P2N710_RHIMU
MLFNVCDIVFLKRHSEQKRSHFPWFTEEIAA